MDPYPRGSDWMPITPKTGSLFHADSQRKRVCGASGRLHAKVRGLSAVQLAETRGLDGAAWGRPRRCATPGLGGSGTRQYFDDLVVTLKKGVNDGEIADIVRFALQWRCVRGVTFQPIQDAGRNEGFDPKTDRIVLSEIRRRIAEAGDFALEDLSPLPCNPDQICIGYGLRQDHHVEPTTALLPRDLFVAVAPRPSPTCRPRYSASYRFPLPNRTPRKAGRFALLPAAGVCAAESDLRTHLPRGDLAVPRSPQLRSGNREALVRPFRPARRADHPVRHLQYTLPTRRCGQCPISTRAERRMIRMDNGGTDQPAFDPGPMSKR